MNYRINFRLKLVFSHIAVAAVFLVSIMLAINGASNGRLIRILIALLVTVTCAYFSSSLSAGPVNKIMDVARKFAKGDFNHRVIKPSEDEMGELSLILNDMAQGIEGDRAEAKAQNQKLAAIFNSMVEGVMLLDSAGRVVSINSSVERIFNVLSKDVERKPFLGAIRNSDIWEVINQVLKAGKPVFKEISLVYPVRRIFQINATPIFGANIVNGCLIVIHDITKMRDLETMRRDFVANVSHELKTPLTSIKGYVETLLDGAVDDKENNRQFLKIIMDQSERLNGLVTDLLALASVESRETIPEKIDINLREKVDGVTGGFALEIKKKSIEIINEISPGVIVRADTGLIDQVLTNLIDNAIKFNKEKGCIKIHSTNVSGGIKIIVEDSGAGIPARDIPRIFERFYRVDKARSRAVGGTGLGLSIVKHAIELQGGKVGVDSTEGLSSKFWFTLPN